MTQPAQDENAAHLARARNQLIQTVKARLKGTGRDVRELAKELVISNPGHPTGAAFTSPTAVAKYPCAGPPGITSVTSTAVAPPTPKPNLR